VTNISVSWREHNRYSVCVGQLPVELKAEKNISVRESESFKGTGISGDRNISCKRSVKTPRASHGSELINQFKGK